MIMELTYTKVGDYYIPNLALDDDAITFEKKARKDRANVLK